MIANNGHDILSTARRYTAGGLSVLPIRADGSKAPAVSEWEPFQERIATDDELRRMFRNGVGIGVAAGHVSGDLEILDIDRFDDFAPFAAEVEIVCPGLLARLTQNKTPGGMHLIYRCDVIEGNQKLAQYPVWNEKLQRHTPKTSFETRGPGGYIVAPGSPPECHTTGKPYEHVSGPDLPDAPRINPQERSVLFQVARSFNEWVEPTAESTGVSDSSKAEGDGIRPGDDYNSRATWEDVLEPQGWKKLSRTRGEISYWQRPGKEGVGWSATTGIKSKDGNDLLCVFSQNAYPLDGAVAGRQCSTYTKFAAFAKLHYSGDFSEAGKALAALGYGTPGTKKSESEETAGSLPVIANGMKVGSGEDQETIAIPMPEIIAKVRSLTGGWPRRVGSLPFVDDKDHGIGYLTKPAALFGWLKERATVVWLGGPAMTTKEELFCELQRTSTPYESIATMPHFPAIEGHYYSHREIKTGNGESLAALLSRFTPETTIDADLLLAAIATPAWGGNSGTRPAFVVLSDHGRGMGKSTVAQMIGRLWGGIFDFSNGEDAGAMKKRLLTIDAITKRVALVDNVKSQRFSWAELESLITATDISGHRLFIGECTRPNVLTWFITLNGPSLSRDLTQRSVPIKLGRAIHSGTWEEETKRFIDENRWEIIGDVKAFFERPAATLEKCSRWGSWERSILARLPEPTDAQVVIRERQEAINGDDEEAGELEDLFAQRLQRLGYDVESDWVHIPNDIAAAWYGAATKQSMSLAAVTRAINQAATEGLCKRLRVNPCRTYGRGILWAPGKQTSGIEYDLREQIAAKSMVNGSSGEF